MNEHDHNKGGSGLFAKVGAGLLVVLIVAVLSFLGGMQYQKGKKSATTDQTASGGSSSQGFGGFQGGPGGGGRTNIVRGQVTAISSTSISVQDSRSNSTTTLDITSDTTITDNGQTASLDSIKVDDNVVVRPNSSNSKQADQIILNPQVPSGTPSSSTTTN